MHCNNNAILSSSVQIVFQVALIFTFLTVFFFVYVVIIEKKEFEKQITYIVKDLMKNTDLSSIINNDKLSKEDTVVIIDGIADIVAEKARIGSFGGTADVNKQNAEVYKASTSMVVYTLLTAVIFISGVIIFGYCFNLKDTTRETFLAVALVGLTEFVFLKTISAQYISADPNWVKRKVGEAIINWHPPYTRKN